MSSVKTNSTTLSVILWFPIFAFPIPSASAQSLGQIVFDEVNIKVQTLFCDDGFNGVNWTDIAERTRNDLRNVNNRTDTALIINLALAKLRTSHTYLYTVDDPEMYELLGVFSQTPKLNEEFESWLAANSRDGLEYEGIGIRCLYIDEKWFVRSVLPDSLAERGGIRTGDEVLSADGQPFHPLRSFQGRHNQSVLLSVRSQVNEPPKSVRVSVNAYDPHSMFHEAIDASARVLDVPFGRIGYVRMWSYAGQSYQDQLAHLLLEGKLAGCDGLILDLRGGWGGASHEFLELFRPEVMTLDYLSRDGSFMASANRWIKPVVLVIDETVRSGKELFTYGFKKLQRGPIVGTRTAGAVTAGSVFPLSHGCVLYLAVRKLTVDGESLEGTGVEPTIGVPADWRYSKGVDSQFDRAILEMKVLLK